MQVSSRKTRRLLDKSKTFHVACGVAICIFSGKNRHLSPQLISHYVSHCVRVSLCVCVRACEVWLNGSRLAQHSWRTSCDVRPAGHVCFFCLIESPLMTSWELQAAVCSLLSLIHSHLRGLASYQSSNTWLFVSEKRRPKSALATYIWPHPVSSALQGSSHCIEACFVLKICWLVTSWQCLMSVACGDKSFCCLPIRSLKSFTGTSELTCRAW